MQDAPPPVSRRRRRWPWPLLALLSLFVVLGVTQGERIWTGLMYEWRPVAPQDPYLFIASSEAETRKEVVTFETVPLGTLSAAGYALTPRWWRGDIVRLMLWDTFTGAAIASGSVDVVYEIHGGHWSSPPVGTDSDDSGSREAPWTVRGQTWEAWWAEQKR